MKSMKVIVPLIVACATAGIVVTAPLVKQTLGNDAAQTVSAGQSGAPSKPQSFGELRRLMVDKSQLALGPRISASPNSVALDDELRAVPEAAFKRATSAYVDYSEGKSRSWRVYVGPGDGTVSSAPCGSLLAEGVLTCESSTDPETGDIVVEMVTIAVKTPDVAGDYYVLTP